MSSATFIRRLLQTWVKDHPEDKHRDVAVIVPQAIKRMALRTGVSIFLHHDQKAVYRIGVFKKCLPSQ